MKNCSEIYVRIVRFGPKLRKWDYFQRKGQSLKKFLNKPHLLPSYLCLTKRTYLKILKICQITNFDIGFQKNNMRSRLEKSIFYLRRKLGKVSLDIQNASSI
jgi:hypothetical protein